MTETLANGYSSESTQRELSDEYQHDRVSMFFKNLCVLVLWTKAASALEGLNGNYNRKNEIKINTFLHLYLDISSSFNKRLCTTYLTIMSGSINSGLVRVIFIRDKIKSMYFYY